MKGESTDRTDEISSSPKYSSDEGFSWLTSLINQLYVSTFQDFEDVDAQPSTSSPVSKESEQILAEPNPYQSYAARHQPKANITLGNNKPTQKSSIHTPMTDRENQKLSEEILRIEVLKQIQEAFNRFIVSKAGQEFSCLNGIGPQETSVGNQVFIDDNVPDLRLSALHKRLKIFTVSRDKTALEAYKEKPEELLKQFFYQCGEIYRIPGEYLKGTEQDKSLDFTGCSK